MSADTPRNDLEQMDYKEPPKQDVELAARIARNIKKASESERLRAVIELPDRHDRTTGVEL